MVDGFNPSIQEAESGSLVYTVNSSIVSKNKQTTKSKEKNSVFHLIFQSPTTVFVILNVNSDQSYSCHFLPPFLFTPP